MFRMLRNNSNLIFLVYSNLTLLDTMVQKEFIINTLLDPYVRSISQNGNYYPAYDRNLYHNRGKLNSCRSFGVKFCRVLH